MIWVMICYNVLVDITSFRSARSLHRFRPIKRCLWEDFNPIWGFDCKHYFFVKNIDDRHDHLAIDDDSFALGTDESLHNCEPPDYLGRLDSLHYLGHAQQIGLS